MSATAAVRSYSPHLGTSSDEQVTKRSGRDALDHRLDPLLVLGREEGPEEADRERLHAVRDQPAIACSASSSFSSTTTLPKQSTRSDTPSIRYLGTMGSGLLLSGMWTTRRMSRPVSPREPRMMWMTSLWPLVVMRPTLAPRFWMIALVPTVVPWASTASSRQSASSGVPSLPATMSRAAISPSPKSAGVEGALPVVTRPASSTTTQSVKVPPMSMPQR